MFVAPISFINKNYDFRTNLSARPTFANNLSVDTFTKQNISFTGADEQMIYDLENITCPCCGDPILSKKDFDKVKEAEQLNGNISRAIAVLKPYEKYMHDTEKQVFNILKTESAYNPKRSIKETFNDLFPKHFNKLKLVEMRIFDNIDKASDDMSDDSAIKVRELTNCARRAVIENKDDNSFRRKAFISDLEKMLETFPEQDIAKKINEVAETLPTAHDSVDAFIVKYAKFNKKHKAYKSKDIGQRLLSMSVGTIEHVKPESKGGASKNTNYLLECGGCNHPRGDMPLDEWTTKYHPEMVENTQKYIDRVIDLIHAKKFPDKNYPHEIKETLKTQSKGLIDLDLSRYEYSEEDYLKDKEIYTATISDLNVKHASPHKHYHSKV